MRKIAVGCMSLALLVTLGASPANAESESPEEQAFGEIVSALESSTANQPSNDLADSNPEVQLTDTGIESELADGRSIEIRPNDENLGDISIANDVAAVFASADDSYNYAVADQEGAISGLIVINDASVSDYYFDFLVDGQPASLELLENGAVLVLDSQGETVNAVDRPWATDANGKNLSTSYSVDGGTLRQTVELDNAAFPVVADPKLACDPLFCTVQFTKAETKTITENGWQTSAGLSGACALLNAGFAVACGALGGSLTITAAHARNTGKCAGIRSGAVFPTNFPVPVIYSGGNCR